MAPTFYREMPSYHLFGMHQRIERYYTDSNGDIHGELANGEGQVDFYLIDKYLINIRYFLGLSHE